MSSKDRIGIGNSSRSNLIINTKPRSDIKLTSWSNEDSYAKEIRDRLIQDEEIMGHSDHVKGYSKLAEEFYNMYKNDPNADFISAVNWLKDKISPQDNSLMHDLDHYISSVEWMNEDDNDGPSAEEELAALKERMKDPKKYRDYWDIVYGNVDNRSPTGIHNPADYLPAMRVGDAYEKQTVYEDIDDDGDIDKVTVEEKA